MESDFEVEHGNWFPTCDRQDTRTVKEMILSRVLQKENVHQWETSRRRRRTRGILCNKGVSEKGWTWSYLGVWSFLVRPSLQNRRLRSVFLNHFCFLGAQDLGKVSHCHMEPDYISKNKIQRKRAKSFIYNFKLKSVGCLIFISTPGDLHRAACLVRGEGRWSETEISSKPSECRGRLEDQGQVRDLFIEVTPNISDSPPRSFAGRKEGKDRQGVYKEVGKVCGFC